MRFWLIIISLIFLSETGLSKTVIETLESERKAQKLTYEEYLVNSIIAYHEPEKLPPKYRALAAESQPLKCGTTLMLQAKENFDKLSKASQELIQSYFLRPSLPYSYVSESGLFRIHYTLEGLNAVDLSDSDNNNMPDFVEEAARALDYSYRLIVDTLGYKAPPTDFEYDGPEYDFYFLNSMSYGETILENEITHSPSTYSSFIRSNNQFGADFYTHGLDAVRVTCAHEFFHMVQLGYAVRSSDLFYFEISSTWMEDVAYDDVNDYYQYISPFFKTVNLPFNTYNYEHEYGCCLWNHMLAKKYSRDIVRSVWEYIERFPALEAMDYAIINVSGGESSFRSDLESFSVWNYFTGSRSNPVDFYPEGEFYPEIRARRTYSFDTDVALSDSIREFSTAYYSITDTDGKRDFAIVMQHLGEPDTGENYVSYNISVLRYPLSKNHQPLDDGLYVQIKSSDMSLLRGNAAIAYYDSSHKVAAFSTVQTPKIPPVRIFPNPFIPGQDSELEIDFTLEVREWVEIKILTSEGRLVKNIEIEGIIPGMLAAGFHPEANWNGTNDDGYYVASGIYLVCIKTDSFVEYRKVAVIRK